MNELEVVEYKGVRVLTTQQIANAYDTEHQVIVNNFNRNKDRYEEGKHFICLIGEDLKEFRAKNQNDVLPNANRFYLWTEKGTFLHAKSLNTDTAWEVYDRLVENYFNQRDIAVNLSELTPELQMFNQLFTSVAHQQLEQKRQAEQLNRIEEKQNTFFETLRKEVTDDFKTWCRKCITKIVESPNCTLDVPKKDKYGLVWNESYDRLHQKRPCRLKQRVDTARGEALRNGATQSKVKEICALTIIANDKDLRPVYELVLKEMMIAYCVEVA